MDRMLFITYLDDTIKSGESSLGKAHLQLARTIYNGNCSVIDICGNRDSITNEIRYIHASSFSERIIANLKGYPAYLNKGAVNAILQEVNNKKYKLVYIDNSISGKLVKLIKGKHPDICIVCFYHDIEGVLKKEQLKTATIFRKINLLRMIQNEKMTAIYANKNIVLNNRDWNEFVKTYNIMPSNKLPIVVKTPNINDWSIKHNKHQLLRLLFTGVDYYPNIHGLEWFIKKVIPLLRCDFELNIVGFHLEKYKDKFSSKRINVIGTVDDIGYYYENSDLFVAPIFEGGGMKVKIGEALSYGKHIVGLSEALTGYWEDLPIEYYNKIVFNCKNQNEFAYSINNLYNEEFEICNQIIAEWCKSEYSLESNVNRMKSILNK